MTIKKASNFRDWTDTVIGNIKVVERDYSKARPSGDAYWICRNLETGEEFTYRADRLKKLAVMHRAKVPARNDEKKMKKAAENSLIEESRQQLAEITSKLKSKRKAKGFSLFDIAAECECYHTQFADIEKNTPVILNVFVRYMNAMGYDLVLKKRKQ